MPPESDDNYYDLKRELSTIYLKDNEKISEWLAGDEWIGLLYGELLHGFGDIIYDGAEKSPIANVVSIEYREVLGYEVGMSINTQIILTKENLMEHMERVLEYAEKLEYYEDCANIRDMIIEYNNGRL